MATFDFPIYKDDKVVKHEQDSILANFQPYYQIDNSVGQAAINKLKNDYQQHLRNILPSSDYLRHLEKKLTEVYSAGILTTDNLEQLRQDSTTAIMIINDKLAQQRNADKLFSVKCLCLPDECRYAALSPRPPASVLAQRIPPA